MDSVTLDAVDRGLLHALQVDGRAPFSRIAEVLDVADRTVARRFARLRAHGLARVTGVPDSGRIGYAEWFLRIRVRPGGVVAVAGDLARRPDTAWVIVLSGGSEVTAILRVDGEQPPSVASLSRAPQVVSLDTQRLLRHLTDRQWPGRTSALTPDQILALSTPRSEESGRIALTDLDRRLLPALARDGRTDYQHLARGLGWSDSAVRRRLEELRRNRVLRFDVEVDAAVLGYPVQAALWLDVSPAHLLAVGRALAAHPEIAHACATTGAHSIVAVAVCRDSEGLFGYLTERIGAIDGVRHVETAPITSIVKRAAPL